MTKPRYTKVMLEQAVAESLSFAQVLRLLGIKQAGGSQSHLSRKIREYGIDTTHFTGQAHNRGKTSINRKTKEDILIRLPDQSPRPKCVQLKRAMIESEIKYHCAADDCPDSEPTWRGQPLTLEVDHVDGDWLNNLLENLRFLCPNCHSQEPTNKPWKSFRSGVV